MTYLKGILDSSPVIIKSNEYKNDDFMKHLEVTFKKADYNLIEIDGLMKQLKETQNTYSTVMALQLHDAKTNPQVENLKNQFIEDRKKLEEMVSALYSNSMIFSIYFKEHQKDFGGAMPQFDEDINTLQNNLNRIKKGIRKNLPYEVKGHPEPLTYRQFIDPFALINSLGHLYPGYTVEYDESFSNIIIRNEMIPLAPEE